MLQVEEDDNMSHEYKLTYFDTAGRAEMIRLIFIYCNQPFEDNRIKLIDWAELKSSQ